MDKDVVAVGMTTEHNHWVGGGVVGRMLFKSGLDCSSGHLENRVEFG